MGEEGRGGDVSIFESYNGCLKVKLLFEEILMEKILDLRFAFNEGNN